MNYSLLQSVFGSKSSAGVLAFLSQYQVGYASEIARYIDMDLYAVQKQLAKFEVAGILHSRSATHGRSRVYSFNHKYPLVEELKNLVARGARLEKDRGQTIASVPLPETLRAIFWDYTFDKLTWDADRDLVIRRVLTNGPLEAIDWLRRQFGDSNLRQWLIDHAGRGLSPRQLRFWSLVLGVPRQQANAWVQAARSTPYHQ